LSVIEDNIFFSDKTSETLILDNNGLRLLNGVDISLKKEKRKPKKSLSLFLEDTVNELEDGNLISMAIKKATNENYEANESALNSLGYALI
jgi:hypothetical protein